MRLSCQCWSLFFCIAALRLSSIPGLAAPVPVELTLVPSAIEKGAVCLDGSAPAYHLDQGTGFGVDKWIILFQGGAWCADGVSCAERSLTSLGSSHFMNSTIFQGILSSSPDENPYFFSWNRVKVRYCDGGSFSGNADVPLSVQMPGTSRVQMVYFRGQRIWQAIIADLLTKGMSHAVQVILSGESAGGLASLIHCNDLQELLHEGVDVKCLSDGGIFLDISDITGSSSMQSYFRKVVNLQNIGNSLPKGCTAVRDAGQCFFPQYFLNFIKPPTFILQSAYDTYQIRTGLVPPSEDEGGTWLLCKENPSNCSESELAVLQGFRRDMLSALAPVQNFDHWGLFLISCFYHTQSQSDFLWNGPSRVNHTSIIDATGLWAFGRGAVPKDIDCPYPCNPTCRGVF